MKGLPRKGTKRHEEGRSIFLGGGSHSCYPWVGVFWTPLVASNTDDFPKLSLVGGERAAEKSSLLPGEEMVAPGRSDPQGLELDDAFCAEFEGDAAEFDHFGGCSGRPGHHRRRALPMQGLLGMSRKSRLAGVTNRGSARKQFFPGFASSMNGDFPVDVAVFLSMRRACPDWMLPTMLSLIRDVLPRTRFPRIVQNRIVPASPRQAPLTRHIVEAVRDLIEVHQSEAHGVTYVKLASLEPPCHDDGLRNFPATSFKSLGMHGFARVNDGRPNRQ